MSRTIGLKNMAGALSENKDKFLASLSDQKNCNKLVRDMAIYRLAAIAMADISDFIVEDPEGIEVIGGARLRMLAPHELPKVARMAVKKIKILPSWQSEVGIIEYELADAGKAAESILRLMGQDNVDELDNSMRLANALRRLADSVDTSKSTVVDASFEDQNVGVQSQSV